MDPSMRDLDRLEELDEAGPSRRVAVLIMAALSTAGLVFAMGLLLRGESARGQLETEPSAQLDAIDRSLIEREAREESGAAPIKVNKTELTFHSSLISAQSPELLAAIEAADAELRSLEAGQRARGVDHRANDRPADRAASPENHGEAKAPLRNLALALAESHDSPPESEESELEEDRAPDSRFALPRAKKAAPSAEGDEAAESAPIDRGYALQVGSYKNPADAELFAKDLENKGYAVFIERATIEGRGEFHRVRLGPFAHRGEALRLRSSFESKERIYPLLVRLEPR